MSKSSDKSLLRCLGEFVGHIAKGVRTPVKPERGPRVETRREVEESPGPSGAILRRTTIEEIELPPEQPNS